MAPWGDGKGWSSTSYNARQPWKSRTSAVPCWDWTIPTKHWCSPVPQLTRGTFYQSYLQGGTTQRSLSRSATRLRISVVNGFVLSPPSSDHLDQGSFVSKGQSRPAALGLLGFSSKVTNEAVWSRELTHLVPPGFLCALLRAPSSWSLVQKGKEQQSWGSTGWRPPLTNRPWEGCSPGKGVVPLERV